jgi:GcrA cell cycle regulator
MRGESWTGERVALLRKLWSEGETAAVIAGRLGAMSRSAVLGKVFRLRLPANTSADSPAANQTSGGVDPGEKTEIPARRRRSGPYRKRSQAALSAAAAAAASPRRKTLLQLTNKTCRWPHGRPGTKTFFFCGAPEADLEKGIPYCARHMRRAYHPSARI